MQKYIGDRFNGMAINAWARGDQRYLHLAQLDAMLEGEFYSCLPYPFYTETTGENGAGAYVPIRDRRPSFQFNLYNMLATQISRKLFGGDHAPALVNKDDKVKQAIDALKQEARLESKMLEAVHWGSVGSVCTIFQIVPFDNNTKTKVVVKNFKARHCTPTFNKLDELSRVLIHYPVKGIDFMSADEEVKVDYDNKPIIGENSYWMVMQLDRQSEITYKPIPLEKWEPQKGKVDGIVVEMTKVEHGLGFVPAHWFKYRTGKHREYDGTCYWQPAVSNIIDFDYTVSQIGSGIRYNSVPQVIVKGEVTNVGADGGLGRGASRFIQIKHDTKDGDVEDKNADVKMLEATGEGMKVGLEWYAPLSLRIAMQQICASLKDPNKVTTAMSGAGMEQLESEFLDLARELRTVFGDEGYLELLKKISAACVIKKHVLMKGISLKQIDALGLAWPPLSSIGMVEFQAMATALVQLIEAKVFSSEESRTYALSQIDMPVESANRDYLTTVQADEDEEEEAESAEDNSKSDNNSIESALRALAATAKELANQEPLNTKFPSPGAA